MLGTEDIKKRKLHPTIKEPILMGKIYKIGLLLRLGH